MHRAVVLLLVVVGLAASYRVPVNDHLSAEWHTFKNKYGKAYKSEVEEHFRRLIFIDNWQMIERHNERYEKGAVSFKMAMNRFGDLLHHELVSKMNGYRRSPHYENGTTFILPENVMVPSAINWVKKGYVTEVKNQGDCGSCYSFSANGALEGQHMKKTGKLVSLSEQNIVDCSSKFGNMGCQGGDQSVAFKYIKSNKGVDTEKAYPYEAAEGKCRFKSSDVGATDSGFVRVTPGDEKKMRDALGTVGPLAVSIDASQKSFGFYSEGVYDEPNCSPTALDHAVLAVGYASYKGKEYWLVKNSWGPEWGVDGYIRMSRNKDNQCGVATEPVYPLV